MRESVATGWKCDDRRRVRGETLKETCFLGIGRDSTGRYVFVAFTLRERQAERLVRPISARYMHVKEVRHYDAQSPFAPQATEFDDG